VALVAVEVALVTAEAALVWAKSWLEQAKHASPVAAQQRLVRRGACHLEKNRGRAVALPFPFCVPRINEFVFMTDKLFSDN